MKQYMKEYIDEMQIIENALLKIFDDDELESIKNFEQHIIDQKIQKNNEKFEISLRLLVVIANNHHRCSYFFEKLEKVLLLFKDIIQNLFSNRKIINIFKNNKRILLFLIKEKIIFIDEYFISKISKTKYQNLKYIEYFAPEIKSFYDSTNNTNLPKINLPKVLPDNFDKNRTIGENESPLCEIIRNDSIVEFVIYVNKTSLFLNSQINSSIFETNSFLIDKKPTLIEYAAFFGSIQIFQYLLLNKVEPTPSLMQYAIHSKNGGLIHLLEENIKINPNECFNESIKCHHNDIATYIKDNFLQNENECMIFKIGIHFQTQIPVAFCYYNFQFFPHDLDAIEFPFYFLSKYKYNEILVKYLEEYNIDINNFLINIDDYEIIQELNDLSWTDGFDVYLVRNKSTSQNYLMQILNWGYEYGAEKFEKSIKFDYPCILKSKGYSPIDFNHKKRSSILYEYKPKSNLAKYIKSKNPKIRDTYDYILILGIAIALRFLIKQNSARFILSYTDILLDENYYPVFANYGITVRTMFLPGDKYSKNKSHNIENQALVTPELLDFVPASFVYQYSIIVYFIIVKKIKFEKDFTIFDHYDSIIEGNRPDISLIENTYIINCLQKCWHGNPDDRLSFDEIIDYITNKEFYSYFKPFDSNAVLRYLNIYGTEFDHIKNKF